MNNGQPGDTPGSQFVTSEGWVSPCTVPELRFQATGCHGPLCGDEFQEPTDAHRLGLFDACP